METGGSVLAALPVKKATLTPKVIINQKFGVKACYKVEEVQESQHNGCPGLSIPQKGPSLYRCTLELPECTVVSDTFKKKKDAEQSAAEMALKKLGINPTADNSTDQDPWVAMTDRIRYLFSDEFLSSLHPLSGHLRASLWRDGDLCGSVPASVIAVCDTKLSNLCKLLNPKADSIPFLALSFIMRAASSLYETVVTVKGQLSVQRKNPYPSEIIESSDAQKPCSLEIIQVKAIHIPCSLDKNIQQVTLNVTSAGYYLDFIAQTLGVADGNKILLSRTIGKASSETRIYFAALELSVSDVSSDILNHEVHSGGSLNARASYFCGQDICNDAIMASIGYTWRSKDLFYEDVSLQSYYRMLISKTPSGIYKLSRDAIFAAELPTVFTTKTYWRGSFPREMLCTLCRQHRLAEPVFNTLIVPVKESCNSLRLHKKVKVTETAEQESEDEKGKVTAVGDTEPLSSGSSFRCEVKLFSKCQKLIVECAPREIYKKQNDSIHNASLRVLSWFSAYFKDLAVPLEKLQDVANALDIKFYNENFLKEFILCPSVHNLQQTGTHGSKQESKYIKMLSAFLGQDVRCLCIDGSDSGVSPSNGALSCIRYSVHLATEDEHLKELLESSDEFEFEVGTGAVISPLEVVVMQMSVGQCASFKLDLPSEEFILAATGDCRRIRSLLSSKPCCLDYSATLLRITEPPEERMEQALFSPPLSKQRVEYAVQHIKESRARSLIDYGCGSGSLLDSLLDYRTSLEKIVGVDISQKSLSRAAKILHSKLSANPGCGIKSAVLYDGSITEFDSRLCGYDIGTCLEVIEHMEEEQASQFGTIVLSHFRPRILIVSTPNYEYNVILQKSTLAGQEEDPDEKTESQTCKFRNHDHKFEWTRDQFSQWASELAEKHNYSVEFSGVGGSGDVEPGFASQIAVFRSGGHLHDIDIRESGNSGQHCKIIWEWNSSDRSDSSLSWL